MFNFMEIFNMNVISMLNTITAIHPMSVAGAAVEGKKLWLSASHKQVEEDSIWLSINFVTNGTRTRNLEMWEATEFDATEVLIVILNPKWCLGWTYLLVVTLSGLCAF